MKIYIGSDHAGYELKEKLKKYLSEFDYEVIDKGAFEYKEFDDYPDYVEPVANSVVEDEGSFGIVIGGSGEGEAMDANRTIGARACEFYGGNLDVVKVSREHNDANILSLGARFVAEEEAKKAVDIFINTKFSGDERHIRRIEKLD
jgi:ribose 5-phosphate isomerase B